MNWREIRDVAKTNPTILIPAGTTETQGPSTYVGFEFVMPERLAEEVAKCTNALVAPTIPFGYSPDFEDFSGTITLRPQTLEWLYEDVINSVIRAGFDHILFLATHMPNLPMLEQVAYRVREMSGIMIAWINPGSLASHFLKNVSPNFEAARNHGADPALSVGKYLEPEAIDLSHVIPNKGKREFGGMAFSGGPTLNFDGFPMYMPIKLQDVSKDTGGFGDTSYASEDQGKKIFGDMVKYVIAVVEQFSKIQTRIKGN
jgi:creatinine amidohydrolase